MCVALVERARKLIDRHGILRKPSVTGAQALALFTQLQHMTDHCPEAAEVVMESESSQAAAQFLTGSGDASYCSGPAASETGPVLGQRGRASNICG